MLGILPAFLDPEQLIEKGGLIVVTLVVFAESGLAVGFFLPGDSLLFFAGLLSSSAGGERLPDIPLVVAAICVAAVVGDQVGYAFGRRVGPALYERRRTRLFNPANLVKAEQFFEDHGPRTIVLARFVPIVRTFAPIVAGMSSMNYRTFVRYNVVGGLTWGAGVTLAGYFLGEVDVIRDHVEIAIVLVVGLSLLPVAFEAQRHRRSRAVASATAPESAGVE